MLEQALPFLAALWLHAAFVDVSTAVWYGWGWMFFRLIYPVCFYYGPPYLFISTLPSYVLMGMLYWPAVTNLLNLLPQ